MKNKNLEQALKETPQAARETARQFTDGKDANTFTRMWRNACYDSPSEPDRYWCIVEEVNDLGFSRWQDNVYYNGKSWSTDGKFRVIAWTELAPIPDFRVKDANTVTIGTESGPISRPFFQIDNQTFFLGETGEGTEMWYADQMEKAFEKLGAEVVRSCSCDVRVIESREGELICKTCGNVIK